MIHIAICEDDAEDLAHIQALITEIAAAEGKETIVTAFSSGEALLTRMRAGDVFDLLVLDVFLPGKNGVATAHQARTLQSDVALAFLTVSREHAVDAYALNALHYLVKPVDAAQLRTLFARYAERVRQPEKRVVLRTGDRTWHFPVSQLRSVQARNKSVALTLADETESLVLAATFSSIEAQLDSAQFLTLSRGFMVNMDEIHYMDRDCARLRDGTEVLLSRRNREEIARRYNDFLFRSMEVEG